METDGCTARLETEGSSLHNYLGHNAVPMLLVETYLAPSRLHGIGLFAKAAIPKGTKVWEFTPGFDQELLPEMVERLSDASRERVLSYAYYNREKMRFILCSTMHGSSITARSLMLRTWVLPLGISTKGWRLPPGTFRPTRN